MLYKNKSYNIAFILSFILFIMCLITLILMFISNIRYQNKIDNVMDKYEKDMVELHKD